MKHYYAEVLYSKSILKSDEDIAIALSDVDKTAIKEKQDYANPDEIPAIIKANDGITAYVHIVKDGELSKSDFGDNIEAIRILTDAEANKYFYDNRIAYQTASEAQTDLDYAAVK